MTNRYLIAHKVRGEPEFDVAQQITCPECHALGCAECDSTGYWWIIPTSGHRAYPYNWAYYDFESLLPPAEIPPTLPDHYPTSASPSRLSLDAMLPKAPVYRRY